MFLYNLDSILMDSKTKASIIIPIEKGSYDNGGLTIKLRTINDSIWIGSGLYFNGNFSFFKKGVRGKELIPYFVDDPRLSNAERMMREANTFRLAPDKSLLIRSSLDAGLIEVYAIKGDSLEEKFSHKYYKTVLKIQNNGTSKLTNESRYGYIDVCLSKERAFGLYCGNHINDQNSYQSQQIHEYDLEGNLLNVLILDTPICAMDISPDGKTIYALDAEGERKLIAFDLAKE